MRPFFEKTLAPRLKTPRIPLLNRSGPGDLNLKWPTEHDPRVPVNVIPNVAIQKKFWGKPDADPPKYSTQILEHLIYEARKHTERYPLLGLYVDPRNVRAIQAYTKCGFIRFHNTYRDEDVEYISMILKLAGPPATQAS